MEICCLSFSCHVTDNDVALCSILCSVCFACMLGLSRLCRAHVGGCGVWQWMVRAGDSKGHMWMMVAMWMVVGLEIKQNSHLQNFLIFFLGKLSNFVSIA